MLLQVRILSKISNTGKTRCCSLTIKLERRRQYQPRGLCEPPQKRAHPAASGWPIGSDWCPHQELRRQAGLTRTHMIKEVDNVGILQELLDDVETAVQGMGRPGSLCLAT